METSSVQKLGLQDVKIAYEQLRKSYQAVLPKVDPALLNDFLAREKSPRPLSYTLEVFTKEGVDTEQAREYIYQKTGMIPAIFDNGTHYVTNQVLTLDILKEISDSDDVVEIRGSHCGGIGMKSAYYERGRD